MKKTLSYVIGIAVGLVLTVGIHAVAQQFAMPQNPPNNNAPQVLYSDTTLNARTGNQVKSGILGVTALRVDPSLINQVGASANPNPAGFLIQIPGPVSVGATQTGYLTVTALSQTQGATTAVCATPSGQLGVC